MTCMAQMKNACNRHKDILMVAIMNTTTPVDLRVIITLN
jgi:hypothetical protein